MTTKLDTQQVEILGRVALIAELIRQGFEVARPERDKGIDLLAFNYDPFVAVPIQMKAYSGASFGVQRKYARIKGLILTYVWHAQTKPRFFVMTYPDAESFISADKKQSLSWEKGKWHWPTAPRYIVDKLSSFENRWDILRDHLKP